MLSEGKIHILALVKKLVWAVISEFSVMVRTLVVVK